MFGKVILTGLAFIAFGLTKLVFNTLVIRRFPPAFLGNLNQLLSLFLLVPLVYAPALGQVISKFASEFVGSDEPHKSQQVFSLSFVLVSAISALSTILVLVFFPHLGGSRVVDRGALFGLAPMLLLYSLYTFFKASYYGFDRIRLYLFNEIISSIVFFAVLAAALIARSTSLAALPFASHGTVFAATAIYHLRDQFRFRAMVAGIAADLHRCAQFFFATVVISMTGPGAFHLGIILTGRLTGDPVVAAYYSVLLYSLQPLNLLPLSLVAVLMPAISRHHGAGQTREGVAVSERAFRPLFLVMTLTWGCGAILGWEVVKVIAGTTSVRLIVAYEIVLFAIYLNLTSAPPSILLNATRHVNVLAWSGATTALAAVGVWYGAIPYWGLLGSAAGFAVLQVGRGVWALVAAHRLLEWRGRVGRGAILTAAAIVTLSALSLTSGRAAFHFAMAAVFLALFTCFHAMDIKEHMVRLVAEIRLYATRGIKPVENLENWR